MPRINVDLGFKFRKLQDVFSTLTQMAFYKQSYRKYKITQDMGASEGKRRGVKARQSWIICRPWCVRWPALPGVTVRSPVSMTSKGALSEEMTQAWTKVTVGGTGKTTALGKHTSRCCDVDKVQGCPPTTRRLASSSIEVTPFPLVQTEKPSLRRPQ